MNGSMGAAARATIGYHAAPAVTVAHVLAALPRHSWCVISDVARPEDRGVIIDHVVVGPPGVFVVGEHLLDGNVTVHDGVLRHNGRNRSALIGEVVAAARSVLAALPGVRPDLVQPIVCVAGGHHARGEVDGVPVCTPSDIVQSLTTRPPIFGPDDLAYVMHEARTRLVRVERSNLAHGAVPAQEQRLARAPMTRQTPRTEQSDHESARWGRLLGAAAAAGIIGVGLTQPQAIRDVVDAVADLVVDDQIDNPQIDNGIDNRRPTQP